MCYRAWNYEAPFPRPRRGSNLAPFACSGCKAGGTVPCEHTFDMGAGTKHFDWVAIQRAFDAGKSITECRRLFGFAYASWRKAAKRGDIALPDGGVWANRRPGHYDWSAIQCFYDEGHTYQECRIRFGFSAGSWHRAKRRGQIRPRDQRRPIERVPLEAKNRTNLKNRLLEAGILQNRCDICGISRWRGRALSIQIDHINGVRDDNRIENLRMLCPNCHSQTETFASRNRRKKRSGLS